ncbi:hypothetical protein ACFLIM_39540 [Nonomuraea sp. M3C6]|uniref:Uncharacterized protein n=1 Tax=Nonomuraea marmarensis TaxID=3351344 RepID=A0ABW7AQJ3_9ACTN
MSDRPRRAGWVWSAIQAAIVTLGAILLVAFPFADLLTWASSPQGLRQPAFWAWLTTLWLLATPVALALEAVRSWHRGYRARKTLLIAWAMIALAAIVQWQVGVSWGEIIIRPVVLAMVLWLLRPIERAGDVGPEHDGRVDHPPGA